MYWLALPRFFLIDFLDPGVQGCSSTAGVGMSAGAGTSSAISSLSSNSESIEAEEVSFVR